MFVLSKRLILMLSVLSIAGLLCASCSDDDPVTPESSDPEIGPPTIPQLMQWFKTMYENMNLDELSIVYDQDYILCLQEATVNEFGLDGDTFNYDDISAIHTNLFSGETVPGPVPAISDIHVTTLDLQTAWEVSTPDDEHFPSTSCALYQVQIEFARAGDTTLIVRGLLKFYADQDEPGSAWSIVGIVDYTGKKSETTESCTWGMIHALYRGSGS